jgi:phosphoglycolate phosphatase
MPRDLADTTIVFDLDGTLIDTAPDLEAATNHALGLLELQPLSVMDLHPFIGHGSKAMIDAGLRFYKRSVEENELNRLHDQFLAFYAANVAVASRPFDGIPELLNGLRGAGARLAVCTNKMEHLSKVLLRTLGLEAQFAAIAGRDTFDEFKPAPGHLTRTIAMAGGRADRAVMVGDSEVDLATAIAARVPFIGVSFGYAQRPLIESNPGVIIDHYRDFMGALDKVLAERA